MLDCSRFLIAVNEPWCLWVLGVVGWKWKLAFFVQRSINEDRGQAIGNVPTLRELVWSAQERS